LVLAFVGRNDGESNISLTESRGDLRLMKLLAKRG